MATLGALIALGLFTRVTFLAFAAPIIAGAVVLAARQTTNSPSLTRFVLPETRLPVS